MKIRRIGFANFRSIGSTPVILDLTKRVNLLIGANNCGKSNVLEGLTLLKNQGFGQLALSGVDLHKRDGTRAFELILEIEGDENRPIPDTAGLIRVTKANDTLRFQETPFDSLDYQEFQRFMNHWLGESWMARPNSELLQNKKRASAERILVPANAAWPLLHIIPQFREITPGGYHIKGTGVVERLEQWMSPVIGKEDDRARFRKVVAFLGELLGMRDIVLDVSRENTELIVERDGLRLPLKNYGTGIHQLIILAITVLAHENALIGIEEPEIHLHPLLQKALLDFLIDKTTNSYVITTHSNAFLRRLGDCHVNHLWLEDGETKSRAVETTTHVLDILADLGVRAADLLQANFVIWVEGPSDRIYLNRWLKLRAPELVEGIDYSIMFYGGRLLAHVTFERESEGLSADELVKLLRINQHSAVLIDSDLTKNKNRLSATKQRIQKECREHGVLCWITKGREIENYLTPTSIAAAYREPAKVQRSFELRRLQKIEKAIQQAYKSTWRASLSYEKNKPDWARRIAEHITAEDNVHDLHQRLDELIKRIRAAH